MDYNYEFVEINYSQKFVQLTETCKISRTHTTLLAQVPKMFGKTEQLILIIWYVLKSRDQ